MFKTIFKYIALLFIIAVAVAAVTVGVMFTSNLINPNKPVKVFGYSFYNFNENKEYVLSEFNNAAFTNVEINVNSVNVAVKGTTENAVHLDIYNKMWGIVKRENNAEYGLQYQLDNGTLKITVTQPKGVLLNADSTMLLLKIPSSYSPKNLIINGVNSNILVGNSDKNLLKLSDVTFNVKKAGIDVLDLNGNIQNFNLTSTNNSTKCDADIAGSLIINTNMSSFEFNKAGSVEVNAKTIRLEGNNVTGNASITCQSGVAQLENVAGDVTINGNVKTTINTLGGNYSDENRKGATLRISNASGSVTAKSTSGETYINNATDDIEVQTTTGNIELINVSQSVTINTTSGICKVTFANGANQNAQFNFTAKNGGLTASKIACAVNINIKKDGGCYVKANFAALTGDNIINAQKGYVSVTAPATQCLLSANNSGKNNINFGGFSSTEDVTNQAIMGAAEGCTTKLTITSTSGKITVKQPD